MFRDERDGAQSGSQRRGIAAPVLVSKAARQNMRDKMEKASLELQFDHEGSRAWRLLVTYLGPEPCMTGCKRFAEVICTELRLRTRRVELKYRICLIKWIEDHIEVIQPFVEQHLVAVFPDGTTRGDPAVISSISAKIG